jgi:Kdo2-lipid IVA lauroyltransferase/acyltransferase
MMVRVLVIPLIYILSWLPMRVLYFKSSAFYLIVYYLIGYRKKVVYENLKRSFPEKSEQELLRIMKDFYRHFCDLIFETIKNASVSPYFLKKHCRFTEDAVAIFKEYADKNQSIVAVLGHCGNWEWSALSYQVHFPQTLLGVYHPLSNKPFNDFLLKWRSKFGSVIIPIKEFYPFLIKNKHKTYTIGLIADQSPPPESAYWCTFLNQETPVFNGPEKIARKFNYPMVYVKVIKESRGNYVLDVIKISDVPQSFEEGKLSAEHVRLLEENIREQPHTWLWSHKRWKHKKPLS